MWSREKSWVHTRLRFSDALLQFSRVEGVVVIHRNSIYIMYNVGTEYT